MHIRALELHLTGGDLDAILAKAAPAAEGVQDLKAHFSPDGVVVTGKYPTAFLTVGFETTWAVEAAGPEVRVTLAALKVMGVPGGFLRGVLMKMARDVVADEPGLRVEGDAVIARPADMARAHGIDLEVAFTRVTLSASAAVIEAGPPA